MNSSKKETTPLKAKTEIGQHFLINGAVMDFIAAQVPKDRSVVEIGAGLGQLTEVLAPISRRVIAVEIDERFKDKLEDIRSRQSNVEVVIANALKIDLTMYGVPWVVGNIPYHITEPLIGRLVRSEVEGVVLLVGKSFAQEAVAVGNNLEHFGKLSMVVDAFFEAKILMTVGKEYFDPPPRTASAIVKMIPRSWKEAENNRSMFLTRQLVLTAGKSPLIKNVLRESLIRFNQAPLTKNEAREIIAKNKVPDSILEKPFEQLNNGEYRTLFEILQRI